MFLASGLFSLEGKLDSDSINENSFEPVDEGEEIVTCSEKLTK
jgi:hypothetical protein